jgi:hypothetical protein
VDILPFVAPAPSPTSCIVVTRGCLTAISRTWAPGVLDARSGCRDCPSRTEVLCSHITTDRPGPAEAEAYDDCRQYVLTGGVVVARGKNG